jgi:hypothetical protein
MKNEKNVNIDIANGNEIERVYTLGDSEMICRKIIELLISRTFHVSHLNYLSSYKKSSCLEFSFKLLHRFDCMANIKCDTQHTIHSHSIQECERPKIDPWASNKTKINSSILETEEYPHQYVSTSTFKSIKLKKNVVEENNKKKQLKDNKDKAIKELLNEDDTESVESDMNKVLVKPIEKKKVDKQIVVSNKKKEIDDEPQIDLEYEANYYKKRNNRLNDSFNEEKENKLRTLFKDKEKDKEIKKKKIKEDEEKFVEMEKKRKAFLNTNSIIHINSLGKLIKFKSQDPDQLQDILTKTNFYFTGIDKASKKKKPVRLKNPDPVANLKEGEVSENLKLIRIEKTEVSEQPSPVFYYQPEPIKSILPEMGVKLVVDGKNKMGNDYAIENRMNYKEFDKLINDMIPNKKLEKKESIVKPNNLIDITEEMVEQVCKESKSIGNKEDIFKEENARNKDEGIMINNTNLQKSIFMESEEKIKENIREMKKSKSTWNMKSDKFSGKVKAEKEFNYQNLPYLNDYKIPDNLSSIRINNDNIDKNTFLLPKSKHGNLIEEMGKRKKYPRERTSQEILTIKGKTMILENNQNKYKIKENNRISNK